MRLILFTLVLIANLSAFSQLCSSSALFPGRRANNVVTYVSNSVSGNTQTWVYAVRAGQPEPSFIFYHNPCVQVTEVGILRNRTRTPKNLVNHTSVPDPLVNDYGWKLEFYADTIYLTTNGVYDVKPIFITMKYSTIIYTDTICGPDCSALSIEEVELTSLNGHVKIKGPDSIETYELQSSKDGALWSAFAYVRADSWYNTSWLAPGLWYLKARGDFLESNVITIEIKEKLNTITFDELGRKVNNDQRILKPFWKIN